MKYIAEELIEKAEATSKDFNDLEKMINRFSMDTKAFRKDHSFITGAAEAAIGIAAIAAGASLINPLDCGNKIPELIGAAFGVGVGGTVGTVVSSIGGIGIAMMGTAFAIPMAAVTAIGASVGALSGMITGWFGVDLATHTASLTEIIFANISGVALVGFGCYMLFLAMKDLWRSGEEFISYFTAVP